MPKRKTSGKRRTKTSNGKKRISELEKQLAMKLKALAKAREGRPCFPFVDVDIKPPVVDDVFAQLRKDYNDCGGRIDVLLDSGGGDIDAAYNLSMLLRKYAPKELTFIVARWAKSAATLLACSGGRILMTPVAELGPVDPQITQLSTLERRHEQFSPLHIQSTLDMIRQEFKSGNEKLAKGLLERLQFPLTLGACLPNSRECCLYWLLLS